MRIFIKISLNLRFFSNIVKQIGTFAPYIAEAKYEEKKLVLKEIGKVAVNFGNLIFTSLVLGSIIRGDYDRLILFLVGGCAVAIFITGGIILLMKGEEE